MVIPQVFRFIQQIWKRPSRENLFSQRYKRLYRSVSFIFFCLLVSGFLVLNVFFPSQSEMLRIRAAALMGPLLEEIESTVCLFTETVPGVLMRFRESRVAAEQLGRFQHLIQQYRSQVVFLEAENKQLRELLKLPYFQAKTIGTAKIVNLAMDESSNTLLMRVIDGQPIMKDMPVVNAQGLVGRVQTVDRSIARVLTIADPSLRIPVWIGRNQVQGIAVGSGLNKLCVTHFANDIMVYVGDAVVTSGQGGIFPPGIPVGTVTQVSPTVHIAAVVDLNTVSYVSVLEASVPPQDVKTDTTIP